MARKLISYIGGLAWLTEERETSVRFMPFYRDRQLPPLVADKATVDMSCPIKPGANMENVDLRDADLRNQDLRCVRFYRANLHRADLRGANLAGADLRWANLHDTKLDGANLEGARRGTQGGLDLQIPGWENDNGILCRKKTVHKLRVWGRDEKNTPHEEFDYSCDVPPELDEKLYWLIAQGLLFERNWCDDGLTWKVSINGKELT